MQGKNEAHCRKIWAPGQAIHNISTLIEKGTGLCEQILPCAYDLYYLAANIVLNVKGYIKR